MKNNKVERQVRVQACTGAACNPGRGLGGKEKGPTSIVSPTWKQNRIQERQEVSRRKIRLEAAEQKRADVSEEVQVTLWPCGARSVRVIVGQQQAMEGLVVYGAEPEIYPVTKGEPLKHCNHEEECDEICILV